MVGHQGVVPDLMVHQIHQCVRQGSAVLQPGSDQAAVHQGVGCLILAFPVLYRLLAGSGQPGIAPGLHQRPGTVQVAQVPVLVILLKSSRSPFLQRSGIVIQIRRQVRFQLLPPTLVRAGSYIVHHGKQHFHIIPASSNINGAVGV